MDASIWDTPLAQETPKRPAGDFSRAEGGDGTPLRPTKRARQTLFLADSDDDDGFNSQAGSSSKAKSTTNGRAGPANKPPPAQDLNIEELFADFDDDDMEVSKPLPTLVDEEELTRRAEAKYKRINKEKDLSLHQIMPSSSPGRESDPGIKSKKGKRKEKGGEEKKARKRQVKLDENLLLSPSGFPQLVKMTKDFRIKGKGYEAADLDRLLKVYQYWTHQLYPKTTFSDTVERVEKLCHTRRMNVSLSVWRDEAHGKPISPPEDEEDQDEEGEEAEAGTNDGGPRASERHDLLPPSSPHRSLSRGSSPPTDTPNVDEEDEEFWKSLDMGLPGGDAPMEESLSDVPPAPPTSSGVPSDMDEDEDMWDIVNQIEQEASKLAGTGSAAGSASASGPLLDKQPPDDDWDDMYV